MCLLNRFDFFFRLHTCDLLCSLVWRRSIAATHFTLRQVETQARKLNVFKFRSNFIYVALFFLNANENAARSASREETRIQW